MERQEIFKQLTEIYCNVLNVDNLMLSETTTAEDIEEWDSLSHIQIVVAIEKHFHIKFSSLEIMRWKNVGEMVDSISQK
jgi:acyl carrier protein